MHQIKYRMENYSPLVISAVSGDMNMVGTEKHIPGTATVGVLAKRIITKRSLGTEAHKDELFYRWFLAGDLSIGPAYCITKDPESGETENAFFPAPLSIQVEKHGNKAYDLLTTDQDSDFHTVSINKYASVRKDGLLVKDVDVSLNFHHARDRHKGIPKESAIFNYESVSPFQCFEGFVRGSEEDLAKLVEICGSSWTAHAGRSKTAQYGRIAFSFQKEPAEELEIECDWEDVAALTFLSDALVRNRFGFPSTDPEDLERYLGGAKIEKSFMRKKDIENFVALWRLKTPSEHCFRAGSSFLVDVSSIDEAVVAGWMEQGVGERTNEGFGRCVVEEHSKKPMRVYAYEPPKPEKPTGKAPAQVLEILRKLTAESLEQAASLDGMNDQNFFEKVPPNSLLSRMAAMASGMSPSDFSKTVGQMRKSARDKLDRCFRRDTGESLYEFMQRKSFSVEEALLGPGNSGIAGLCEEIADQSGAAPSFEEERMGGVYWNSFFSTMRKRNDKGRG